MSAAPHRVPPPAGYFIAGTDTEVGKTHTATALIRELVRRGLRVAAMKPVAAGAQGADSPRNEDALALAAASNVSIPYETLNPYCLLPPISPHIAAKEAGIVINPAVIYAEFSKTGALCDRVIVEGAGGWLAPISDSKNMEDIAIALRLPVILVVGLRLGCLNHALLTARSIRGTGLPFAHWIGNSIDPKFERAAENIATLTAALGPPLAIFPHGRPPLWAVDVTL
jgi:dethiobiotin synthetase